LNRVQQTIQQINVQQQAGSGTQVNNQTAQQKALALGELNKIKQTIQQINVQQ